MRVLFVCHRFPYPPKRGGKIRPFNIISHLSDSDQEVTVCSLARDPQEAHEGAGVAPHCKEFVVSVTGKYVPLLQRQKPALKLYIIGAQPSKKVRDLGTLPGVTVTGSVDDIRPYVQRCQLSTAPLEIARETQNKILESMAQGVQVICSRQAAGGVDARVGEDLLVAETPEQYCEQILDVLDHSEKRHRLSEVGRQRVLSHHNWVHSTQRLDVMMHRLLDNPEWVAA